MATTGGTANRGTQSSLQPGGGHARTGLVVSQRRSRKQKMSDQEVTGFLGRKIWQAMNDEDGDLSDIRKENFNLYVGKEYGDERDGYSKYVSRETLETVEWVLPSVLRVFLSGDRVVVFDPVEEADEQAARQETDITNYFVMKANNSQGFLSLHHWFKDALMYPNGYVKIYMEKATRTDVGTVTGLNEYGVQMLADDPEVEILEQRSRTEAMQPDIAAQATGRWPPASATGTVPVELFDLKIRTTREVMELRVDPVPPEECLVDNDCTSLNLDEADFVCHRVRKTYTQLVQAGYDPDELDMVGSGENFQWNDERVNRLFLEDENPDAEDEDDPSMRQFWVHECYVWMDYNGDGIAEFRRVVLIGDRIFENEETNHQPLVALSSILMQHKHTGLGYIDIVKDLQLLGSVLTRQLLDNIYKINVRRKVFSEDALTEDGSTIEALLNTQAEFIPVRGLPQNAFVPEPAQSIIGELLPVLKHFADRGVSRTGVSPDMQISGNDLQEVRQEVFSNALDRASQRIEMLTRIFAETGYRQLMLKAHQLLRSHWDIQKTVKLRGEWVNVDPQGWRDRTDMTVNVGLGHNTKQIQIGLLTQLLTVQKEAMGLGLTTPKELYNTLEKLTTAAGLGDARQAFVDPSSPDYQPPQPAPDPNLLLAQAQAQALQADAQTKAQKVQLDSTVGIEKLKLEEAIKQAELEEKRLDREIRLRELALKEAELEREGVLKAGELQERLDNLAADTLVKHSVADLNIAKAVETAMETGLSYQQALQKVTEGGEQSDEEDAEQETGQETSGEESSDEET